MTVGDGCANPLPDLGPLIDEHRVHAVRALIDDALARGGKQVTGSITTPSGGCYLEPSPFTGVPDDADLATQEVFGPAAAIFPFATEDEALDRANSTEMGLAAYVYTRDVGRSWRLGERLEAGIVGVNNPLPSVAYAPMGGVKQSGLGREGGHAGLEEFQETHYLALAGI